MTQGIKTRSALVDVAAQGATLVVLWQLEECGAGWAEGVGETP